MRQSGGRIGLDWAGFGGVWAGLGVVSSVLCLHNILTNVYKCLLYKDLDVKILLRLASFLKTRFLHPGSYRFATEGTEGTEK